jgi:hypothetical protein
VLRVLEGVDGLLLLYVNVFGAAADDTTLLPPMMLLVAGGGGACLEGMNGSLNVAAAAAWMLASDSN